MRRLLYLLTALLLAPLASASAAEVKQAVLSAGTAAQTGVSASPQLRPNIIHFLIDDLGWKDIGCQGSAFYQTPNIDRLAAEGVRFTDAYAACAVCSPTRAAILTGKYPARILLTDWLPSGRWDPKAKLREGRLVHALPVEELTLAEALREGGYRTANIGKWHLGSEPFSLPEHHGFEVNIGGNAHGAQGSYFFPYPGDWKIPTTGRCAVWNVLPDGKEGQYLTDRLTHEAVKFIRDAQATKNQDPATKKHGAAVFPLLPALRRPHAATGEKGSHREV
jgi:arylsulfatase A-like enzyme